jgi:prophage antirepressor-like protein
MESNKSVSVLSSSVGNIRSIIRDGEPWFVTCDVLVAMGSSTPVTKAVLSINSRIGDGHTGIAYITDALGRTQKVTVISESAVTFLLSRSNGPAGVELSRVIHTSILPQAKKIGQILQSLNDFEVPEGFPDMYVYAIREKDTGNIKLGISADPERRLRDLQTGNSSELELVAYVKAKNRFADETALHKKASGHHIRGEWFSQDAAMLIA